MCVFKTKKGPNGEIEIIFTKDCGSKSCPSSKNFDKSKYENLGWKVSQLSDSVSSSSAASSSQQQSKKKSKSKNPT